MHRTTLIKNRICFLLIGCLFLIACGSARQKTPLAACIGNRDRVIAEIRSALKAHSAEITIRFSCSEPVADETADLVAEWMEDALAETDDPAEGDYIRYQYGGYALSCRYVPSGDTYDYTLKITPSYYSYLVQEEEAGDAIRAVMDAFSFDDHTEDREKVRAIYDYVCTNIRYDKVHSGRDTHTLRSTAYSAMHYHAATCQGFCVTLYRMLRMAGIDCRVIVGEAGGVYHAWNIVRLGDAWYALDATWDAGQAEYRYFLKGSDAFADHTPAAAFLKPAFRNAYPLSVSDHPDAASLDSTPSAMR